MLLTRQFRKQSCSLVGTITQCIAVFCLLDVLLFTVDAAPVSPQTVDDSVEWIGFSIVVGIVIFGLMFFCVSRSRKIADSSKSYESTPIESGVVEPPNKKQNAEKQISDKQNSEKQNLKLLGSEDENFVRLFMLVTDKGSELFRKVCFSFTTTKCKVKTFKEVLVKAEHHKKTIEPKFVKKVLWPASNQPETVDQLDITSCNALLYLKPVSDLKDGDTKTLRQALDKIRGMRNTFCHDTKRTCSDVTFNKLFDEIRGIFKTVSNSNPEFKIPDDDVIKYKTLPITEGVEQTMQDVLKKSRNMEKVTEKTSQEVTKVRKYVEKHSEATEKGLKKILEKLEDGDDKKDKRPNIPKDYDLKLREELKYIYKEEMALVRNNPFYPDKPQPIERLYVDLSYVKENVHHPGSQDTGEEPFWDYCDIFYEEEGKEKGVNTILIHGKPGVGKTIFTKRLAFDWAEERESVLTKRYENVFVLTLRKVQPGQTLVEVISDQLLPYKSPLIPHLESYIENTDKCLFVCDGLDEMEQNTCPEIDKLIKRKYLRKSCLVITSRPSQAQHLAATIKVDVRARIEGLSKWDMETFITRFFDDDSNKDDGDTSVNEAEGKGESDEEGEDEKNESENENENKNEKEKSKSEDLIAQIENNDLGEIAKLPLILNMICLLYEYEKSLPENLSKIYKRLQLLFFKRNKEEESVNPIEFEDVMQKLGKIAFEGLLKEKNQLFFQEKKILEEVGKDAFKIGLIWVEKAKYGLDFKPQVHFLHKSFQESAAAFYIGKQLDSENSEPWETLKSNLGTNEEIGEQELLLQFCAGASPKLADKILEFLEDIVIEKEPELPEILRILQKMSNKGDDLLWEELDKIRNFVIDSEIEEILNVQLKLLRNMEKRTSSGLLAVQQLVPGDYWIESIKKTFDTESLKLEKCMAFVRDDDDLEQLVKRSSSVSMVKLEGEEDFFFEFTENTVRFLEQMLQSNQNSIMVSIGKFCGGDNVRMSKIIQLVANSSNVKYKEITLQHPPSSNDDEDNVSNEGEGEDEGQGENEGRGEDEGKGEEENEVQGEAGGKDEDERDEKVEADSKEEDEQNDERNDSDGDENVTDGEDEDDEDVGKGGWEDIIRDLMDAKNLVALNFSLCDIPVEILPTVGTMISKNNNTLLQLDLSDNRAVRKNFNQLGNEVKCRLLLTVLKLSDCVDTSDSDDVRKFIALCPGLNILDISWCRCDISNEILNLNHLTELDISAAMIKETDEERIGLDVGRIFENLDKIQNLEILKATYCEIDEEIKRIPFKTAFKLKIIELQNNCIGDEGIRYLCEHHAMLPEVEDIQLYANVIEDDGGQFFKDHLHLFKKMKKIWIEGNRISKNLEKEIEQKCDELDISRWVLDTEEDDENTD